MQPRALARLVVALASIAVIGGLLRVPPFAPEPAQAADVPVVTNPVTDNRTVDRCGWSLGCFYPNGYQILDPTVALPHATGRATRPS